jgi:[protein-PII] uridylyltransferase
MRQRFRDGKAPLLEQLRQRRAPPRRPRCGCCALARHVDATLCELWQASALPAGAALVAVGGYGRGELFPSSDVDVLILLPDGHRRRSAQGRHRAVHHRLLGHRAGDRLVGAHVDECVAEAQRDVTVQTALLESRLVCGARACSRLFASATAGRAVDAKAFLRAKTLEMRQRHVKYEDTPYALEPNCKESPGGLRDLQVVIWVARAAGLGRTWAELAAKGLVTPFEVKQLQRNEGVLKLIRARLHLVAGRREDRLVFDLQTAVAESFGYSGHRRPARLRGADAPLLLGGQGGVAAQPDPAAEHRGAHQRQRGRADAPDQRPLPRPRRHARGGARRPVRRQPARHPGDLPGLPADAGLQGLSARTLRALYNARNVMDGEFRRDPVNRELFMDILRQPKGQTHAFRLMNQTSVLGRYLWVFRRIVGRMQHDLFHVYTVDQHILMVLRNVRRFFIPEHAHEYPFCSAAGQRLRPALGAVRGGAVPRRGQGPRRRPLRPRRHRGAPLLPRPRHRPRTTRS